MKFEKTTLGIALLITTILMVSVYPTIASVVVTDEKCRYITLIAVERSEGTGVSASEFIKLGEVNRSEILLVGLPCDVAQWVNITGRKVLDNKDFSFSYYMFNRTTYAEFSISVYDVVSSYLSTEPAKRFRIIEYTNISVIQNLGYAPLEGWELSNQGGVQARGYTIYLWTSDIEKNNYILYVNLLESPAVGGIGYPLPNRVVPDHEDSPVPVFLVIYKLNETDMSLRVDKLMYFIGLEGKFLVARVYTKPLFYYNTYIFGLFDSRWHIPRKSWLLTFTRELFNLMNSTTIYINSQAPSDYLFYSLVRDWYINNTHYEIKRFLYPNGTLTTVWYCNSTIINSTSTLVDISTLFEKPSNLLLVNITSLLQQSQYLEYVNESRWYLAYLPEKSYLVIVTTNYDTNEIVYIVAHLYQTVDNIYQAELVDEGVLYTTTAGAPPIITKVFSYKNLVFITLDHPDTDVYGFYCYILDLSSLPTKVYKTDVSGITDIRLLDENKALVYARVWTGSEYRNYIGYLYFNGTVKFVATIPSGHLVLIPSKTLTEIIGKPTFIIPRYSEIDPIFFVAYDNIAYFGTFGIKEILGWLNGVAYLVLRVDHENNYTVVVDYNPVICRSIAFDPETGEPRIRIWGIVTTKGEVFELPYVLVPRGKTYEFYFFRVKLTVNTLYVPTSRVDYVRDVALYKLRLGLLYKRGDVSVGKVVHWVYIRTGGVDVDYSVDYVDDATIRLSFKTVLHPPFLAGEQFGGVKVKIRELPIDVPLTEYEKLYLEQAFDIHFVKEPKAYASPELVTTFGGLAGLLALAVAKPMVGIPLAIIYCSVCAVDVWYGGTHAKIYPCFIRANIVRIQIGDREVKWAVPIVPDTKGGEYAVEVLERLFPNVIIHRPIKVGRSLQEYLHAIRKGVVTHLDVKTMIIEDIAKYGDVTKAVIKGVETYLIFAVTGEPAVIGWTYNLVSEFDMHIRGMYFRIAGLLPPEKIKDIGGEIKDPKAILSTLPYITVSGHRVNGSITPSGVVYEIGFVEGVDSLVITPPDLTNKYLVKGTLEADVCIKCPFIITDWGGFLRFHYTTPIEFKIKMIELVDLPFRIRSIVRELPFIAPEYLVDAMKKANVREVYNNATNTYTYVITGLDVKWMDPYNSMSAHYCKWFNYTIISTEPPNAWIRVYIEGFKVMTIPQEAHVVIGTNVENDIDYGVALLLFEYTGVYKPEEVVAEVPKEVKEVLGSRLLKYLALGKLITAVVLDKGTIHLPENGNWTKSYPIQKYIVEALARATVTGKVLVVVAGKISATKDYYWSDNFDYADTIVTAVTNITKGRLVVPIKVVDVDTDEPIQGATVKIFKKVGASEELVAEGTTNASGMVTLYVPCAGTYKLYAEHPDYKPNYIITQIYYNTTVPYVIKLARKEYQQWVPPPPPVAGEYGAEEGYPPIITPEGKKMYWLLIHVVTKDGFPVSGATVKIYNATEQLYDTEVTNGTGTAYFLVPEGFSGTYEVYYNELYVNGTIAPVYKHRVIEVVLPIYSKQNKTGHVVFYVYDVVSRTPIEGAKLEIKEPYYNRLVAVMYTNATGYAEKWLPYGAYNLTVYAGGYYNYSIQFYVLSTEQVIRIPLLPLTGVTQYVPPYPPANDSRPPVIINGTEYYYLWVRVSYEDGAPVHGANVTVYDAVRYSDITNGTGTVYFLLPAYKVYYVNVTYLNYTAVRSLNLTHHTFLVFKVPYKSVYFQPEVLIKNVDLVFVRGIAPAYHLVLVTILTNVPQTVVVEVNVTRVDTGELIKSYNVTFVCDEAGVYTNATFVYINVTGQNVPFRVCAKIVQFEYDTNLDNNFMCSAVRKISSKRGVEVFVLWKVIDFGNKYRYILPELTKVQVCIKVKTTFNLTTYKLHVKPVIEYMDYIKKRRERIEKLAVITTENPSGAVMWFNYTFVIPWTDVINLTALIEKLPIPVDEIKIFNASIRVDPNARLERVDLPKTVTSEQEFTYKIVVKSNVYDPQASATVVFIDADTGEVVYSWSSRVELKKGLNTIVIKAKAPRVEPKKIFGFEVAPTVKKFIVNATVNGYNVYPEDDTLTTTVYVSSKIPLLTWAFIGVLALIILLLILVMVSLLARKTVTIRRTRYL